MRLLRPLHYARDERAILREKRRESVVFALKAAAFAVAVYIVGCAILGGF